MLSFASFSSLFGGLLLIVIVVCLLCPRWTRRPPTRMGCRRNTVLLLAPALPSSPGWDAIHTCCHCCHCCHHNASSTIAYPQYPSNADPGHAHHPCHPLPPRPAAGHGTAHPHCQRHVLLLPSCIIVVVFTATGTMTIAQQCHLPPNRLQSLP